MITGWISFEKGGKKAKSSIFCWVVANVTSSDAENKLRHYCNPSLAGGLYRNRTHWNRLQTVTSLATSSVYFSVVKFSAPRNFCIIFPCFYYKVINSSTKSACFFFIKNQNWDSYVNWCFQPPVIQQVQQWLSKKPKTWKLLTQKSCEHLLV